MKLVSMQSSAKEVKSRKEPAYGAYSTSRDPANYSPE